MIRGLNAKKGIKIRTEEKETRLKNVIAQNLFRLS